MIKAIENNSNESKIEINMYVNFVSSNNTRENRTTFVWSDDEEIRLGSETDDDMILLKDLLILS